MSESKHNRRTQKTKRAIYTAFSELLTEKELHMITVQELVDRADRVYRAGARRTARRGIFQESA